MATRDDPGDSDGGQEGRSSERRAGRTKKRRVSWEGVDGGEDLPSLKRRRKGEEETCSLCCFMFELRCKMYIHCVVQKCTCTTMYLVMFE